MIHIPGPYRALLRAGQRSRFLEAQGMSTPGLSLLRETLLNTRLVTEQQWSYAVKTAEVRGTSLEKILVEMGVIEAEKLSEMAEMLYGIPRVSVHDYAIEPSCLALLPREAAERYQAIPLYASGAGRLTVAMVDPMDRASVDALTALLQKELRVVWIDPDDLQRALKLYDAGSAPARERVLSPPEKSELTSQMAEDAPVARLSDVVCTQAVRRGASAIHLEPGSVEARVRLRVDGVMRDLMTLPTDVFTSLIARLKRNAGMDADGHGLPQEGRCEAAADGHTLELRLAAAPCLHGEKLVVGLVDADRPLPGLDALGFTAANRERFRGLLARPCGMIGVAGPVGSGKTATLHAALQQLDTAERSLQTVEDPIERRLARVCQLAVDEGTGLTLARGLRAVLRLDPDVVMVDELRDAETAELAVGAALAGRLVLAALTAGDAVEAMLRLVDLGVPAGAAASALSGVLAQRLVRRLCPACAGRESGCSECDGTGYRGRVVVSEVLVVNPSLARGLAAGEDAAALRDRARVDGCATLRDDAAAAVAAGLTSRDEVRRVLGLAGE